MINLRKTELRIHCIGTLALDMLSTEQIAAIFGITSQGIFIKGTEKRMIFLSFEDFRGPLIANLSGDLQHLGNLSSGGEVTVSQKRLIFSNPDISISATSAKVWQPPILLETPLDEGDRHNLISKLALDVYHQKGEEGFSGMLPILVGFSPENMSSDYQFQDFFAKINQIRNQIAKNDLLPLSQTIRSFLGLGSGLTPSGDDFIIGLLLVLNRWEHVLQPGDHLPILNQQVVESAYKCTTTLSANLIECAALGYADERLIQAVDFLAAAKHHQPEVLYGLLNWGNSSGVDALVGMITAFSPLLRFQSGA